LCRSLRARGARLIWQTYVLSCFLRSGRYTPSLSVTSRGALSTVVPGGLWPVWNRPSSPGTSTRRMLLPRPYSPPEAPVRPTSHRTRSCSWGLPRSRTPRTCRIRRSARSARVSGSGSRQGGCGRPEASCCALSMTARPATSTSTLLGRTRTSPRGNLSTIRRKSAATPFNPLGGALRRMEDGRTGAFTATTNLLHQHKSAILADRPR
jgi:hypothetical protein